MSELRWVRMDSLDDGVRVLTLDRPPVNALGRELVDDLTRAVAQIACDNEARCVVLRSAGKNFSAGADLKERKEMSIDEIPRFVEKLVGAVNAVAALPIPTIAAVSGVAAGGGCELALGCDLRILSSDARIGLRETALAIIPGAGGTQRLPRLVGPSRAKRWIFTAALHSAEEALADGVADRVVPVDRLEEESRQMAALIASNGPVGIRQAKLAIDGGLALPLDRALDLEWECWKSTLETEDRVEALRAFAEKRPPRFRGR